jgi:hypothetical protein
MASINGCPFRTFELLDEHIKNTRLDFVELNYSFPYNGIEEGAAHRGTSAQ